MIATAMPQPGDVGFDQTTFNLARWEEVLEDASLYRLEQRIETDRFGHLIMTPPPIPQHGGFQAEIGHLLRTRLTGGRVMTECPISTSEGVKACDVVWISTGRFGPQHRLPCLSEAPEICVEVLSPSNSKAEMDEKKRLYFEAGAEEVWLCAQDGKMHFFRRGNPAQAAASARCPDFPAVVKLV